MKKNNTAIFAKVEQVAKKVINNLKNNGYIVPVKKPDGSVHFDNYIVEKTSAGFYSVKGTRGHVYVEHLNLPQSAAIIANDLALGRILNKNLINLDREYGYKVFDEELFKKNIKNKKHNIDQLIHYKTRMETATHQAKQIKNSIDRSFLKLSCIR